METSTTQEQDSTENPTDIDDQQISEPANDKNVVDTSAGEAVTHNSDSKQIVTEVELTPEEQIERQKAEKIFRKQEEEWLNKREKVTII